MSETAFVSKRIHFVAAVAKKPNEHLVRVLRGLEARSRYRERADGARSQQWIARKMIVANFLIETAPGSFRAIITNPPYELATKFIERALSIIPPDSFVAMLLRTDFDHARSRHHLFGDCPLFCKQLVLTKRIKWFEDSDGQPSFNYAWFTPPFADRS